MSYSRKPIPVPSPTQAEQWDVPWSGQTGWTKFKKKRSLLLRAFRRKPSEQPLVALPPTVPPKLAWVVAQQEDLRRKVVRSPESNNSTPGRTAFPDMDTLRRLAAEPSPSAASPDIMSPTAEREALALEIHALARNLRMSADVARDEAHRVQAAEWALEQMGSPSRPNIEIVDPQSGGGVLRASRPRGGTAERDDASSVLTSLSASRGSDSRPESQLDNTGGAAAAAGGYGLGLPSNGQDQLAPVEWGGVRLRRSFSRETLLETAEAARGMLAAERRAIMSGNANAAAGASPINGQGGPLETIRAGGSMDDDEHDPMDLSASESGTLDKPSLSNALDGAGGVPAMSNTTSRGRMQNLQNLLHQVNSKRASEGGGDSGRSGASSQVMSPSAASAAAGAPSEKQAVTPDSSRPTTPGRQRVAATADMTIAAQVSDAAVSAAVQGAQEEDEEGGGQFPAAGYHPSQNYQMRQQGVMTWSGGANNGMQQGQQRQTDGATHGSGGGGNRGPVSASLPESPNNPRVTPASVRWFHPHDAQLGAPSPAVGGFGRGVARSMSLEGPAQSSPINPASAPGSSMAGRSPNYYGMQMAPAPAPWAAAPLSANASPMEQRVADLSRVAASLRAERDDLLLSQQTLARERESAASAAAASAAAAAQAAATAQEALDSRASAIREALESQQTAMREAEAARVSEAEAHERREVTLLSENEMLKQRAAALQDTVGRLEMARLRAEAGTSEAVAQHHPAIAAAPAARAPRPAETVWGARSAAAQHQQQSLHLSPREGATPSGHDSHNSRRVKVQPTPRTQPTVGMVHTMQGNVIHVRAPNNMRQGGGSGGGGGGSYSKNQPGGGVAKPERPGASHHAAASAASAVAAAAAASSRDHSLHATPHRPPPLKATTTPTPASRGGADKPQPLPSPKGSSINVPSQRGVVEQGDELAALAQRKRHEKLSHDTISPTGTRFWENAAAAQLSRMTGQNSRAPASATPTGHYPQPPSLNSPFVWSNGRRMDLD